MLKRTIQRARLHAAELLHRIRSDLATGGSCAQNRPPQICQLEERILLSASPVAVMLDVPVPDAGSDSLQANSDSSGERVVHVSTEQSADSSTETSLATATAQTRELVLIDTGADDYQQLVDDLLQYADANRGFELLLIDSAHNGIEQITEQLSNYRDVDALHIVSHGSHGQVKLGNTWLNIDNVDGYTNEIAAWSKALGEGADLLIYGCNLAATEDGQALVVALAALCDCDVAASVDDTGHHTLGGDWEWEYSTGVIDTGVAFSADLQSSWSHLLTLHTVRDTFSVESYGNSDGSVAWAGNWIENDTSGGGASNGEIRVDSSDRLKLKTKTATESIYRQVDLSTAVYATLTYNVEGSLGGGAIPNCVA